MNVGPLQHHAAEFRRTFANRMSQDIQDKHRVERADARHAERFANELGKDGAQDGGDRSCKRSVAMRPGMQSPMTRTIVRWTTAITWRLRVEEKNENCNTKNLVMRERVLSEVGGAKARHPENMMEYTRKV